MAVGGASKSHGNCTESARRYVMLKAGSTSLGVDMVSRDLFEDAKGPLGNSGLTDRVVAPSLPQSSGPILQHWVQNLSSPGYTLGEHELTATHQDIVNRSRNIHLIGRTPTFGLLDMIDYAPAWLGLEASPRWVWITV